MQGGWGDDPIQSSYFNPNFSRGTTNPPAWDSGPVSAILVWNKIFKEEEESVEGGGAHTPDIYLHFGRDKQTNGQMHQQMITIYTRETDTQMSNRQQERERIEPTGKAYL